MARPPLRVCRGEAYRERRSAWSRLLGRGLAAALLALGALAGCAVDGAQSPLRTQPDSLADFEVASTATGDAPLIAHVVEGADLVAPILGGQAPASGLLEVERSGGDPIRTQVYRFEARVAATQDWLEPRVRWRAVPPDAPPVQPAPTASFHAAVIPAAARLADGERLRIGERSVRVRSWERERGAAGATDPLLMPTPLLDMLAPIRADPAQAWRAALLEERLAELPPGDWLLAEDSSAGALAGDHALAALEAQTRLRWGVALRELRRLDPDLAARVREGLTRTVRFIESGVEAPAWRAEPAAESELLQDLLAPALSEGAKRDSARTWLAQQPGALAWIIDDAAALDSGRTAVRAGVANLSRAPVDAQVRWTDSEAGGRLADIAPGAAAAMQAPTPTAPGPLGAAAQPLLARVGAWSAQLGAQRQPIVALPPSLRIEGFHAPWSMRAWVSASASLAPGMPATVALLQRDSDDAGWELYIECAKHPGQLGETAGEDAVRVFLGPRGGSRAILRITKSGELVDELASPAAEASEAVGPPALPVRLPHGSDGRRWWAIAPIPAWAVEPGSLLRIGIERRVGAARAHWPRPIFPWEDEPSRALVDLSRWSPLGGG